MHVLQRPAVWHNHRYTIDIAYESFLRLPCLLVVYSWKSGVKVASWRGRVVLNREAYCSWLSAKSHGSWRSSRRGRVMRLCSGERESRIGHGRGMVWAMVPAKGVVWAIPQRLAAIAGVAVLKTAPEDNIVCIGDGKGGGWGGGVTWTHTTKGGVVDWSEWWMFPERGGPCWVKNWLEWNSGKVVQVGSCVSIIVGGWAVWEQGFNTSTETTIGMAGEADRITAFATGPEGPIPMGGGGSSCIREVAVEIETGAVGSATASAADICGIDRCAWWLLLTLVNDCVPLSFIVLACSFRITNLGPDSALSAKSSWFPVCLSLPISWRSESFPEWWPKGNAEKLCWGARVKPGLWTIFCSWICLFSPDPTEPAILFPPPPHLDSDACLSTHIHCREHLEVRWQRWVLLFGWIFSCAAKWFFCVNRCSQNRQVNGLSPEWMRSCLIRLELCEKVKLQIRQTNGRSPEWVRMWVINEDFETNFFLHLSQG